MSALYSTQDAGALLVSTMLSFSCFGVVVHQAFSYFTRFPKDRAGFKAIGGFCLLLCIVDTAVTGSWSYVGLVNRYGDVEAEGRAPWEFAALLFMMGTSTITVQSFYAWRIARISERGFYIIPSLVLVLSLIQFITALTTMPIIIRHPSFAYLSNAMFPAAWLWLSSAAVADLIITVTMYYHLHVRSRGMPNAQTLFHKVFYRFIHANTLSLMTQLMIFVTFRLKAAGCWWLVGLFTITKTLSFSMFSSFNSRVSESDPSLDGEAGQVSVVNIQKRTIDGNRLSRPPLSTIRVESETKVEVDTSKDEGFPWNATRRKTDSTTDLHLPTFGYETSHSGVNGV